MEGTMTRVEVTLAAIDAEIQRLQMERDLLREAAWQKQLQEFERERQERHQLRMQAEAGGRNESDGMQV